MQKKEVLDHIKKDIFFLVPILTIFFVLILSSKDIFLQNININFPILIILISICICLILIFRKKIFKHTIITKKYLICGLIIYTFVIFGASVYRHINFGSALFDFGLEHQVVMNTSNGDLFASSLEVKNYLGDHFSLITLPISLIYKVFPSFITLYLLQALAITIAVIGIYKFSKLITKSNKISLIISIIFSVYIPISGLYLFDYHPVTFALPLLIWAIYYYFNNKLGKSLVLFFLASICKEDVNVFIFAFGLFLALKKDKKSIIFILYGLLMSLLTLFVFIPYFRGAPSDTLSRYSYLGSSFGEMILNIIKNPLILLNKAKILYLLVLFWPLLFIPLLKFKTIVLFLPNLLINIITNYNFQFSGTYQYDLMVSVGIFIAVIFNFQVINNKYGEYVVNKILILLLIINAFWLLLHPINKVLFLDNNLDKFNELNGYKKDIKIDDSIGTLLGIGGQLGEYKNLCLIYPNWIDNNCIYKYAFFDKFIKENDYDQKEIDSIIQKLLNSGYTVYKESNNFLL